MTIEGIPLNEPEDQGVYFSNYPDFTNSIKSMQIQRGVGTTSNGVASYAGSINFEVPCGFEKKGTEFQSGYGSFQTYRFSIENYTGLNKNNVAFYTRYSNFGSQGYKYNSSNEGQSFFISGGLFNKKHTLKLIAFSGIARNDMAWFAVSEDDIKLDPRTNYNTSREDDNFKQSLIALKYKRSVKDNLTNTFTVFYNRLDGDWDLDLMFLGMDSIYNYGLGSDFYGFSNNTNYRLNNFRINFGVSFNNYIRTHSGMYTVGTTNDYKNQGNKYTESIYLKMSYDWNDFTFYGDLQSRMTSFTYYGDMNMNPQQWIFFNPKLGLSYRINKDLKYYAYVGTSNREPTRTDIFMGEDNPSTYVEVEPESVTDYETGISFNREKLKSNFNLYYMDFKNEITLLGALGSNGLPLMTNVENSYRSGVEFDINYSSTIYEIYGNVNYSYNRIKDGGKEFQPLLTPDLVSNLGVAFKANNFRLGVDSKYQSKSYIDWENTLTTPEFAIMGAKVSYKLYKNHTISLRVNNIFNKTYFTNGYADLKDYLDPSKGMGRYFYVNPPRNFFITYKMTF